MKQNSSIRAKVRSVCALLALAIGLAMAAPAVHAQGSVVPPNGTLSADVVDLSVQGAGGAVQWKRTFNGAGWRFNRHWDGISASYKPVMTQNTGGGSPSASGEPAVCWIWVDEDWQPGDGVAGLTGTTPSGPVSLSASSYLPANRAYSQSASPLDQNISSGFAGGCGSIGGNLTGGSSSVEVFEGWRRQSTLYVGSGGTYIFKNRYVLKKQPVQKLPALDSAKEVLRRISRGMVLNSATLRKLSIWSKPRPMGAPRIRSMRRWSWHVNWADGNSGDGLMTRDEAIDLLVRRDLDQLSNDERETLLLDWWAIDASDPDYDSLPAVDTAA